jgi:uncharacterized membrane protein
MNTKQLIIASILIGMSWVVWYNLGFRMGAKSSELEMRDLAKTEFIHAITWAVDQGLLIVNTNNVSELKESLDL